MFDKIILLKYSFDLFCAIFEKDNLQKICLLYCLLSLNSVLFKPCLNNNNNLEEELYVEYV